jgi:predicted O-methyltransferase YrrM
MNYRLLPHVPGFEQFYGLYKTQSRNWKARKAAGMLTSAGTPAAKGIGMALRKYISRDSAEFSAYFQAIEKARSSLNQDVSPLVDGTLGEAGIYDRDLSVRDANKASKPPDAARFLALLSYFLKPSSILELGTNTGISSAYLAMGSRMNNPELQIVTLDSSPYRQRVAKGLHARLGLKNIKYVQGLFADTLGDILPTYKTWDLVFIDGHHQYQPTLDYFSRIYPFCSENAVVVFDDIRWSDGMKQAWQELSQDARARCVIDLHSVGILITGSSPVNEVIRPEAIRLF